MFDLANPVPFSLILLTVVMICLVITIGILFVNYRTKKMKEQV